MKDFEPPKITRGHIARAAVTSLTYGVKSLVGRDYGDRLMSEGLISQTFQELGQADITFVEKALGYTTLPAIPLAGMKLLLMMFGPKAKR